MVLIDASTRWSHVCLLSRRNHAFARFIAQIIKLRAHYPKYGIKIIRMDNAAEFSSRAFNDYCMALSINVKYIPYVHTQNGPELVARPLLHNCNLPTSCWGHAVLYATNLIQLRPTAYHTTFPL